MSLVKMSRNNSWSLVRKLYVSCAAACFFLILATSIFFYASLAISIQKAHEKFLVHKILVIQQILNAEQKLGDKSELNEDLNWELGVQQDYYFVRVIDLLTHQVTETKKYFQNRKYSYFTPVIFPQPNLITHQPTPIMQFKHHGRVYLLLSQAISANNREYIVQVAINVSYENRLLRNFRIYLSIVLVIGFFLSLFIGKLVAKRGLKPLFEVTQSIQNINISRLHDRLQLTNAPKELLGLIIAFNAMLQRLEEGVKRLSQFSADLAHELRTPVNNLTVAAEIQLSRVRTAAEYQTVLQSSLEDYEKLSRIIDGMLFLARAEHASGAIEKKQIDIKTIFSEMKDFFEAQAEEKHIDVVLSAPNDLFVVADPLLLQRALINLISNAMQYAHSSIRLNAFKDEQHRIVIQVIDDGDGISTEHLKRIFQRFYRVDFARSRETGGTGLGLAIVKSIMELHGGIITVESEVGKGTCFSLKFP